MQIPIQVEIKTTIGIVVSEMTYTVSSGTLNSSIPYHTTIGIVLAKYSDMFIIVW